MTPNYSSDDIALPLFEAHTHHASVHSAGGPASSTGSLFGSMGASQPLTFNLNSSANPFAAGGANLSIAVPNGAAAAGGSCLTGFGLLWDFRSTNR